ncbi:MAG: hypothetical protein KatS3mg102_1645 [Planctomycetota bacterium]|nr:MAG: hypothetical protein KatS3mg102_1645 [Planctomycetota bacterium]
MELRLSEHARWFGGRRELVLFHQRNGAVIPVREPVRQALLPLVPALAGWPRARGPADPQAVARARERLLRWRLLVPPDCDEERELAGWYPLRSPWSVFYVEADGSVLRARWDRTQQRPVLERLAGLPARLWQICDGTHPLAEILADAGQHARALRELLGRWTGIEQQLLKWLPAPANTFTEGPPPEVLSHTKHLRCFGPAPPARPPAEDEPELTRYHRERIRTAEEQFELRESTLSHLYREPHPALGGRSYGARLAEVLRERGLLGPHTRRIVEVGGGTGAMAEAFLEALPAPAPVRHYTIVELAPALLAAQRRRLSGSPGALPAAVHWVQGHAEALPLRSGCTDLLLCNEVIADLRVAPDPARPGRLLNAGALVLLQEIARVLAPGGGAFVSEYGELEGEVRPAEGLDHAEHTIRFGELVARAHALGLQAALEPLDALFGFAADTPVLFADAIHLAELDAIARHFGGELPALAYTPAMLQQRLGGVLELDRLFHLHFSPLGRGLPTAGLAPAVFKALLLRKPRA